MPISDMNIRRYNCKYYSRASNEALQYHRLDIIWSVALQSSIFENFGHAQLFQAVLPLGQSTSASILMPRHTFPVILLIAFTSAKKLLLATIPSSMSPSSEFLIAITLGYECSTVEVYCNRSEPKFEDLAARWSDIDRKTPKCIILPQTEEEVADTVSMSIHTVFKCFTNTQAR